MAALPAHAFYLPLRFDPSTPSDGQSALLEIRVGDCDTVHVLNENDRQIETNGNVIRVTIDGQTAELPSDCDAEQVSTRVRLPALSAGTYRVELYRRPMVPLNAAPALMQSATLTVAGASTSVPALSTTGLLGLALVLLMAGRRPGAARPN